MDIVELRTYIDTKQIVWRNHILVRMHQRGIHISDVINCIMTGEIIENYENDYPFPSGLVFGKTSSNVNLHVVCAIGRKKAWMITTYYPDKNEWFEDYKTRRK